MMGPWPDRCGKPNSCEKSRWCQYGCGRGGDISLDIDAAVERRNAAERLKTKAPDQTRGIWLVSIMLDIVSPVSITTSSVLCWRWDMTKEQAIGEAVTFAMQAKPGYSISEVNTAFIPARPPESA